MQVHDTAVVLSAVLSVKMSVEHISANFNCAPFTFSPVFIIFFFFIALLPNLINLFMANSLRNEFPE